VPTVLLPPELDPSQDQHGAEIDAHLPLRDGAGVTLPQTLTYVFIVFTNRSGSSFLGELLASTGFFNVAGEPLNGDSVVPLCAERGWHGFGQYFAGIVAEQARNGHFVLKASIGQLSVLTRHGILPRIIARSRFVVVERTDKLAQAISWRIALLTGRFSSHVTTAARATVYDGASLHRDIEDAIETHATIDRFMMLNGIVPFHVTYEALTTHPRLIGTMLCAYLGQPTLVCDPSRIALERQATELNAEWRARFLAEETAFNPERSARAAPSSAKRRYWRSSLAELAADPALRVDEHPVATQLAYLPARTVAVPPLAFGDAVASGFDAARQARATEGFAVAHPAAPAWLLRNARVHGALGIVTVGDRVIAETADGVPLHSMQGAEREANGGLRLLDRPESANVIAAFHLLGGRLESYPAWLLDLAARFSQPAFEALGSAPGASAVPLVLVPPLDVFWKWESLGVMLPGRVPHLALGVEGSVLVQRLLYVPRLGDAAWAMHPATAPLFDAVRDALAGPAGANGDGGRLLFVRASRGAAPLLANEAEVAARAEASGFELIEPGAMPFARQVQAFAQASHIVAANGPALANLVFCRPGTTVCELRAEGQTGWTWRHLAALRGLRYSCLCAGGGPPAAGVWIDPARLQALLRDRRFHDG
jgi:LPS sulfotransferase NodH/capsular polysaccharide biosynthesis protein